MQMIVGMRFENDVHCDTTTLQNSTSVFLFGYFMTDDLLICVGHENHLLFDHDNDDLVISFKIDISDSCLYNDGNQNVRMAYLKKVHKEQMK